MKNYMAFIEESVEFRGTTTPIIILNVDSSGVHPNLEERETLDKFYGLRILAVNTTKKLYIANQFKLDHTGILQKLPKTF